MRQGTIGTVDLPENSFDVAVLADVIEHTRHPLADLAHLWRLLRPGGALFIALPSLDSWSARLMRERWMEFKLEHLFYFDSQTVQTALLRGGFEDIEVTTGWKTLSPGTSSSISEIPRTGADAAGATHGSPASRAATPAPRARRRKRNQCRREPIRKRRPPTGGIVYR